MFNTCDVRGWFWADKEWFITRLTPEATEAAKDANRDAETATVDAAAAAALWFKDGDILCVLPKVREARILIVMPQFDCVDWACEG